MSKPEVLEKEALNLTDLKSELRAIKKRDEELSFRGNKVEEYVNDFARLTVKDAKELAKKLEELNVPRLKPEHIKKLTDLLPRTDKEAKMVMQAYPISISSDHLKKIAETCKAFHK